MADTKISGLPVSDYIDGTEELVMADGEANYRTKTSDLNGGLLVVLQSNYTLSNSASVQKLFNSSTNGALTLITGIYSFESILYLTSMSGTSGNGAFSIAGTATLARQIMIATGIDSSTPAKVAAFGGAAVQGGSAFSTNTVPAAAGTAMAVYVKGMFDVTSGGTIIPSIALANAAAAVVNAGSFFRCKRINPTATAKLGDWS